MIVLNCFNIIFLLSRVKITKDGLKNVPPAQNVAYLYAFAFDFMNFLLNYRMPSIGGDKING